MKKRPMVAKVIGVMLILSPIYYYLEAYSLYHFSLFDFAAYVRSVGWLVFVPIALTPIIGALVLWFRPTSWYIIVAFMLGTIVVNVLSHVLMRPEGAPFALRTVLMSSTGLICAWLFLRRELRTPYFNPRLRWWENAARHPIQLRVQIQGRPSSQHHTFDLSRTGCFLMGDEKFTLGERLELLVSIEDESVRLTGSVVWISDGVAHPRGVGIRFEQPNAAVGAMLKRFKPRASPRYVANFAIAAKTTQGVEFHGTVLEMGWGGCRISANAAVNSGDVLDGLTLVTPEGPVKTRVKVVWVNQMRRELGAKWLDRQGVEAVVKGCAERAKPTVEVRAA